MSAQLGSTSQRGKQNRDDRSVRREPAAAQRIERASPAEEVAFSFDESDVAVGTSVDELPSELDPVVVYLQRVGDVRLLNRLGEQTVAQQIEEGTQAVFEALLAMPLGRRELLDSGNRLLEDLTYRCEVMESDDGTEFEDTSVSKELEKFAQQLESSRDEWEKARKGVSKKKPTEADFERWRLAQTNLFRLFREFGFGYRVLVKVLSLVRQHSDELKRALRQLGRMATSAKTSAESLLEKARANALPKSISAALQKRILAISETISEVEQAMGLEMADFLELSKALEEGQQRAEQGRAIMILANLRLVV